MPSLIECVINDLEESTQERDPEYLLAHYDMDAILIADASGAWERLRRRYDHSAPSIPGLTAADFTDEGPAVYETNGYMVVRGREDAHSVFFVYERSR